MFGFVLLNGKILMKKRLIMLHGLLQVRIKILYKRLIKHLVTDGSLKSANDRHGDLSKARQFGWTTQVETFHGYAQCFDRLKQLKVIP
jgi:hypothetical protein